MHNFQPIIEELSKFFNEISRIAPFEFKEFIKVRSVKNFYDLYNELERKRSLLYKCMNRGAYRVVIELSNVPNYVFKINLKSDFYGHSINGDCCERELRIYRDSINRHVDKFFAPCYFLGNISNMPIYIMQKAEIDWLQNETHLNYFEKPPQIIGDCSDYYLAWISRDFSEDDYTSIAAFMLDYDIVDIHEENIGYLNGIPVMIDYAGLL